MTKNLPAISPSKAKKHSIKNVKCSPSRSRASNFIYSNRTLDGITCYYAVTAKNKSKGSYSQPLTDAVENKEGVIMPSEFNELNLKFVFNRKIKGSEDEELTFADLFSSSVYPLKQYI